MSLLDPGSRLWLGAGYRASVRSYPGAQAPDRTWTVDCDGLALAAHSWGDPANPPLLLAHGGFDFARTFDRFAPMLAAGGWCVTSWDQRGHGDSTHATLYSWDADLRDAVAVADSVSTDPMPVVGHSKGGQLMLSLAEVRPDRISAVVNLDGMPSQRNSPDVSDRQRTRMVADDLAAWLDHRRRTADLIRRPGTIEGLAKRRQRMNPRLEDAWLEYLVTVGGYSEPDGWRWKLDPSMRFGGFGPYRPEWALARMPGLGVPLMAVLGTELEEMGWGTQAADVEAWLPRQSRVETLHGAGHFVHIEQPETVSGWILEFLS